MPNILSEFDKDRIGLLNAWHVSIFSPLPHIYFYEFRSQINLVNRISVKKWLVA